MEYKALVKAFEKTKHPYLLIETSHGGIFVLKGDEVRDTRPYRVFGKIAQVVCYGDIDRIEQSNINKTIKLRLTPDFSIRNVTKILSRDEVKQLTGGLNPEPYICPTCRRAITKLVIIIPEQRGTIDLDVPEEDNPLVTMTMTETPVTRISCPECRMNIPENRLAEFKINRDEMGL